METGKQRTNEDKTANNQKINLFLVCLSTPPAPPELPTLSPASSASALYLMHACVQWMNNKNMQPEKQQKQRSNQRRQDNKSTKNKPVFVYTTGNVDIIVDIIAAVLFHRWYLFFFIHSHESSWTGVPTPHPAGVFACRNMSCMSAKNRRIPRPIKIHIFIFC